MLYLGYAALALLVWIAVGFIVATIVCRMIRTDPPAELERELRPRGWPCPPENPNVTVVREAGRVTSR